MENRNSFCHQTTGKHKRSELPEYAERTIAEIQIKSLEARKTADDLKALAKRIAEVFGYYD